MDDSEAVSLVTSTDYTQAFFVLLSQKKGETKHAYVYRNFKGYRICVVGHAHKGGTGGNAFIPGYDDWQHKLEGTVGAIIWGLSPRGTYPGDDRLPRPLAASTAASSPPTATAASSSSSQTRI